MLQDKIIEDLKKAMKAKDESKTSILRMVLAAFKNKRIELIKDLTEEDAVKVVQTLVKQYRDSVKDFERGGREDLVLKIKKEIETLETYLPKGPSDEEVQKVVEEKVAELGASGPQDFGRIMGSVMKQLGSGANGNLVSKFVQAVLSQEKK